MTSWDMQNAQKDLTNRQNNNEPKSAAEYFRSIFADGWQPDSYGPSQPESKLPPSVFDSRGYRFTSLDDFRFDHLQPDQKSKLQNAVGLTRQFINSWRQYPGLSMVLSGSVGTGKTTMADNIKRSFTFKMHVLDENDQPYETMELVAGRIYTASEIMAVIGGDYWEGSAYQQGVVNLSHTFDRVDLIVVDDLGQEEIRYAGAARFDEIRQKRYGELFDWAYNRLERHKRRIHIVLTTMTPLTLEKDGRKVWHPDFVNIIGQRALTRLNQMARGYLVDLSGLPDYRPYLVD